VEQEGLLEMTKVLERGPPCKIAVETPHLFLVQDHIAIILACVRKTTLASIGVVLFRASGSASLRT
jgi:hypothetical protein